MTQAVEVLYLFALVRIFNGLERAMDSLIKDVIPLLQYLLPGFLAAWIFYSLTAFKRPDTFGQIIQALIFTFVIQSLVVGLEGLLLLMGERFITVGVWDKKLEALWSAVIAVVMGFLSCHIANSDKLHALLRKLKVTTKNSFPCEWYSAFLSRQGFVILHLIGGKRLFGWPSEWPSEPASGQFVLEFPSWIDKDGNPLPSRAEVIVIDASKILWVEFATKIG